MHILTLTCQAIVSLVEQTLLLPQSVAIAFKQKRQRIARNDLEAERLDRIRNPSKYLGN
jgi:hypothetical protein